MHLSSLPRILLLVGLVGCSRTEDRPVIENRLRRAEEAAVQEHVTGATVSTASAPSAAASDEAQALAALGYMDEGEALDGQRQTGAAQLDAARTAGGINVFTVGARAGALAIDMTGTEVHRWDFALTDAWPGLSHPEIKPETVPWRRVVPLENGDLVGIWSGYGIARITADSTLVWGHWLPVHHDLHVEPDGSIVALVARKRDRPDLYPEPLIDDALVWLSPDGFPTREISLLDAFERYEGWASIWDNRSVKDSNDVFHSNTVTVLDKDYTNLHPSFTKGRVLTSMRHLSAVALVDPDTETVVWALQGPFSHQHDPQLADDGLWIFDNRGGRPKTSRMLRLDAAGDILWKWTGDEQHRFFSKTCGHAQQLSNGNLLVVSSEQGAVFEVTPEKDVVWRYNVPFESQGKRGGRRVMRLFSFERLETVAPGWLRGPEPG